MLKKRLPRVICIIVILIIGFTIELTAASTYRIMAASSLQEPLNEIKEKYEQEYRDYELEINYAGSQVLFSQIKMGVDFDLFLSANHDYLKQLKKEDRIKAETIFTKNELLIIINSQKNRVDNLEDLMSRGYSLLIGVESVPVGSYTIKMIDNYVNSISKKAKKDKFKSDFNSLVVSREFDVKSVLNKVKLGAADAGIVYLSDYNQDQDLYQVKIPKKFNVEANYYMGLNINSSAGSEKIYNYILSSSAQQIFLKYNFKRVKKHE